MYRRVARLQLAVALGLLAFTQTAAADKGCKNIQSRCAMEIGGRCDPKSGRWEYGRNGAGGNIQAFNACVARESSKGKR